MTNSGENPLTASSEGVFLTSERYRIWIDDAHTGHVRVIKRIYVS